MFNYTVYSVYNFICLWVATDVFIYYCAGCILYLSMLRLQLAQLVYKADLSHLVLFHSPKNNWLPLGLKPCQWAWNLP